MKFYDPSTRGGQKPTLASSDYIFTLAKRNIALLTSGNIQDQQRGDQYPCTGRSHIQRGVLALCLTEIRTQTIRVLIYSLMATQLFAACTDNKEMTGTPGKFSGIGI